MQGWWGTGTRAPATWPMSTPLCSCWDLLRSPSPSRLSLSPSLPRPPSLSPIFPTYSIPQLPRPHPHAHSPPNTTNEQQQPQPNATHYHHHRPRKPICPAPQNPLQQQQRHAPGAPIHTLQCASRPPESGSLPPSRHGLARRRCGVESKPSLEMLVA
jgi:hypothetical protein